MTTLLTGGTGFLGAALLGPLAAHDDVVALHRPTAAVTDVDGVRWVAQDLAAPLTAEVPDRLDAVVHLAQSRLYREFPESALDIFELNAGAAVRLFDWARRAGVRKFVLASSGAVYVPSPEPLREEDALAPSNLYATCKLAAEHAAVHYGDYFDIAILRYFFIYGPGQRNMFIPGVVSRVVSGSPVSLSSETGIRVNPVFVEDAVAATLAALTTSGVTAYNVAGGDVVSLREIAEAIGQLVGQAPSFVRGDASPDLIADIGRMSEALVPPRIGIHEGLARTIAADVGPESAASV
jgi:nucleoside-diphosphate-sugar epimerase